MSDTPMSWVQWYFSLGADPLFLLFVAFLGGVNVGMALNRFLEAREARQRRHRPNNYL
jgi:hypothetical protein